MPKILAQLKNMKRADLVDMAAEFTPPIDVKRHWTAQVIAKAIRDRQIQDAAEQLESEQGEASPITEQPKDNTSSEFEQMASASDTAENDAGAKNSHGGKRDGAGNKKGNTQEKAAAKRVEEITIPNQSMKHGCQALFAFWALRAKLPNLCLSEKEAERLALPLTQLQEYYFKGAIPEIVWVWISAAWTSAEIFLAKIEIVKQSRQQVVAVPEQRSSDDRSGS